MATTWRHLMIVALAIGSSPVEGRQINPKQAAAAADVGWRISPEKINIRAGEDRALQALDDEAQELHNAVWMLDDHNLADLEEDEAGRVVIHSKGAGTV